MIEFAKTIEVSRYENNDIDGLMWQNYPYFQRIENHLSKNKILLIRSFRHSGISTFLVIRAIWHCLQKSDQTILFFTPRDRYALNLSYLMKDILKRNSIGSQLPNDHHCKINGNDIYFSSEPIRKTVTHLYLDDAAFSSDMEERWKALFTTITTDTEMIISSVPSGTNNWFYDIFTKSVKPKMTLDYRDHPRTTVEWEQKTIKNLGMKGFLQEIAGIFLEKENV